MVNKYIKELSNYRPTILKPDNLREFWLINLEKDDLSNITLELQRIDYPLRQVEVYEATLLSEDDTKIKGWYVRPKAENVPALVRFHGYSSNRGQISELLFWALQGYAVLGMDVRGQCGETPDNRPYSKGHFSGWMTLGLDSPENFYYCQVYLDCVRMVEALSRRPEIDSTRVGLFGKSQGGGLALVTAALNNKFVGTVKGLNTAVRSVAAAIPFLCDFPGAYNLHSDGPMQELVNYFRLYDPQHQEEERIFKVLSYFDALNLAPWINSNTLVSVGLRDTACPPATIYAMYSQLTGNKELVVYPEYGHETVDQFVDQQIFHFAQDLLVGKD